MLKKTWLIALCLLLLTTGFAQDFSADKVLPSKTLLYLGVEDGKAFCEEMRSTGLWKLFTSEEWKAFFQTLPPELWQMVEGQKQQMEGQIGFTSEEILQAVAGEFSVALVDVMPMGDMPMPVVFVTWDLGSQQQKVSALLNGLKQQLFSMDPSLKEETYEVGGYQVSQMMTPAGPVFQAYLGTRLLLCNHKALIESALNGTAGNDTLANSASFKAVKQNTLQGRNGKLLFLNVKRALELANAFLGPQAQEVQGIVNMVGAQSIEALGLGMSFRHQKVVESLYLHTPNGRAGILGQILPTGPVTTDLVKYLPDNLLGFSHGAADLSGLANTLVELMQQFSPSDYRGFLQMEQGLQQQLGFHLRNDLLGNLGNEILFSISCNGGFIPDVALQISLKDEQKFADAFGKLLQMVPEKHRFSFQWQQHDFTYFNYSTSYQPIPVAPTFAIENGRLLVALYPETAKNVISQTEGKLPEDVTVYLEGRPYTYTEYFNLKEVVMPLYRTALPLVQSMAPKEEVPVELALLPSPATVEQYVENMGQVSVCDDQGLLVEWHSPFGTLPLVALSAAGAEFADEIEDVVEDMMQDLFGFPRRRRYEKFDTKKEDWKKEPRHDYEDKDGAVEEYENHEGHGEYSEEDGEDAGDSGEAEDGEYSEKPVDDNGDDYSEEDDADQNGDAEEATAEATAEDQAAVVVDGVQAHVLAVREQRNWKSEDPTLKSALQKVWFGNSHMKINVFAAIPAGSVAYGDFNFSRAQDDTGNDLTPENLPQTLQSFPSFSKENIDKGEGYNFEFTLPLPAPDATSFDLVGNFKVKVAKEISQMELPGYKKLVDSEHTISDIPGMTVQFTKKSDNKSLRFEVDGDVTRLLKVMVVKDKVKMSASGWNSFPYKGKTSISYWFSGGINDNDSIMIEYAKVSEEEDVVINVQGQQRP